MDPLATDLCSSSPLQAAVIEQYIKLYPERSDNWLAEDLGVDEKTVGVKREALEGISESPKCPTAETKDGRTYPRKQRKPKAAPPEPEPTPELQNCRTAKSELSERVARAKPELSERVARVG